MAWINLNASDPAPPANAANVHFRTDNAHLGTEADPIPTTAFLAAATPTSLGLVMPDGTSIQLDATGRISVREVVSAGTPISGINAFSSSANDWQNSVIYLKIDGTLLLEYPALWNFAFQAFTSLGTGPIVIAGMGIYTTLHGSDSVLSFTPVTIGGQAAPTLPTEPAMTTFYSDVIDLQTDSAHDYWVYVQFAAGANSETAVGSGGTAGAGITTYYYPNPTYTGSGLATIPVSTLVAGAPTGFLGAYGVGPGLYQLVGDVTAGPANGLAEATLAPSGVTPGIYTNPDITVDAKGRITAASNGSSGMTNPMTTEGDIIYGGASGTPTRLPAGTAGQLLQTDGTSAAPSWVNPPISTTHSEPLTDGNANFIFAATPTAGGDIIVVTGVPN
ncbi:hypothetical protein H7849_11965 [Alloacidobacterium dinghuense]|uniref:Uncharacterized protein n=1 Tax=Alloacidobacterium dinghuense TaxID=2763107 RepID=A0A7G8BPS2_9BACT|nr:hypothetical protein [Alloacidobacterium dinghuense]QNI34542.1 hypothetical protein H7849_11965 [Alloacidobacterium dinghuense]